MTKIVTEFPRRVKTVENIFIPLKDGTRLAAKMWLPEDAEQKPVPVILEYIPYRKRDGTRTRDQGLHMYFAGHGYACVRLDIRGTGDSEGLIDDEYTVQEQLDGCEAIAWLAKQSWCDGQVAMIGISWGGFNGLQIAARQPPALKTIITVGSTDDRYATDIHWVGGCISKDNFDWSSTMFAHNDLPPDPEIVGEKWRAMWKARMEHNRALDSHLAEAPAPRCLLEAGLGLRGFLKDQNSGLCRQRLGRQLFRKHPAPAGRTQRPAPRAHRPLGPFLSL